MPISKIRMTLAGLTAVALMGGVMAADPADAGKKKKKRAKAKYSKVVVQKSTGGNATAGNGGAGGAGGASGYVNNTGNVFGGGLIEVVPAPGGPALLVPGPGGAVFSGTGGEGGAGANGGNASGGIGGNNTNTSTVTVTRDDHSIDVG